MTGAGNRSAIRPGSRHLRLAAEFAAIFVVAPLVMAVALSPQIIWGGIAGLTGIGILLLTITPGFQWRSLLKGPLLADRPLVVGFVAATAAAALLMTIWLVPHQLFALPQRALPLWITIMLLYPLVSALPQELVFRALFFERYGPLFPDRRIAMALNASCFSLAHLFFGNWVAVTLTFVGGLIFAFAYLERRSFSLAWLLHSVAGQIIFTSGLGIYFYHGAIPG